ncbi:hypothetical protein [Pleionea sp. CnH1-48]|uniref:hypothetical protein n=1 Tax=Pleionea sp. CnH1-48 TaxID=2954494 RepID=UPI002096B680|nr:hypothetical protein [Pleionea sp. CnH1-48]MCO7224255.1 hypothetical protein [Pleionea sp. CnH1-48]
MDRDTVHTHINSLFQTVCIEVFEAHGSSAVLCDQSDVDGLNSAPIAVIDAGSQDFEILALLVIPMSVLSLTYPMQDEIINVDESELEDWLGEFSNQTIGRLKNKLLNHNCRLDLGLPDTYFDSNLQEVLADKNKLTQYSFKIDQEYVNTYLGIEFLTDELRFDLEDTQDTSAGEGELELF